MTRISDLKFHILQDDGQWRWLPITESAYYKSLRETDPDVARGIFNAYHLLLEKYLAPIRPVNEINYGQFLALFVDIAAEGFRFKGNPITFEQGTLNVTDGQHRLSILYFLHGDEVELKVIDNKVVAVRNAGPWAVPGVVDGETRGSN
jgi:hypothetical protein